MPSWLLVLLCLISCGSIASGQGDCDTSYAPSDDLTKPPALLSTASTVLEEVAKNDAIKNTVKIIGTNAVKLCQHLPVIGAAFSLLGAGLDIFGPKSESDELKCMRQEFAKINQKLDKLQKKLEEVDKKLDAISKQMEKYHVYQAYNQYFKEPILRTVSSYNEYIDSKETKYTQKALLFSCLDDQPIHPLDWLNRTIHVTNDPSGLFLLEFIFSNPPNCDLDGPSIPWAESIFYHAALAATMDEMCFATDVQKEKPDIKKDEVKNQPEYQRRAVRAEKLIHSIKDLFEQKEKERQNACFETSLTKLREAFKTMDCKDCGSIVSAGGNIRGCNPLEMANVTFDQLEPTVCLGWYDIGDSQNGGYLHNSLSPDKSKGLFRNPFGYENTQPAPGYKVTLPMCGFTNTRVNIFVRKGKQCDPKVLKTEINSVAGGIAYEKIACTTCPEQGKYWKWADLSPL